MLIPTPEMILLIEHTMAGELEYVPEPFRLDPPAVEAGVVEVERRVVVVVPKHLVEPMYVTLGVALTCAALSAAKGG